MYCWKAPWLTSQVATQANPETRSPGLTFFTSSPTVWTCGDQLFASRNDMGSGEGKVLV